MTTNRRRIGLAAVVIMSVLHLIWLSMFLIGYIGPVSFALIGAEFAVGLAFIFMTSRNWL